MSDEGAAQSSLRRDDYSRSKRAASFVLRLGFGLGVSAFFIWLTIRGSDLESVLEDLRTADYRLVAASIGLLLLAHVVRTARWGLLLAPHGSFSISHLNRAAAVGFMALLILPMRLGELGRPWLISRPDPDRDCRTGVPMSAAMGTLVFERLIDGILMTGLLFILLSILEFDSGAAAYLRAGSGLLCSAFLMASVLGWAACRRKEQAGRLLGRLGALFGSRAGAWIESGAQRLMGGMTGPRSGWARPTYLLATCAYWAVDAVAILLLARAFGIEVGFVAAVIVLCAQVVGVMIPAGPGMLGTYQYFTILGLSFFVSPEAVSTTAVAFANVMWLCIFVQQTGLGLILLPRRERVLSKLARGRVAGPQPGSEADPCEDAA